VRRGDRRSSSGAGAAGGAGPGWRLSCPAMTVQLQWPFDWTVYAGLAIFCLAYTLLAPGRGFRPRHGAWFALGVLTIWVALETPIDTLGDRYLQSVHMVQHVLLLVVAPPLLLLG